MPNPGTHSRGNGKSRTGKESSRRKYLKGLAGVGVGTTTALSVGVGDARADRTGQTEITIGIRRKDPDNPLSERVPVSKYVPTEWYESLRRANSAKEDLESKLLTKSGIVGIGVVPGEDYGQSKILVRINPEISGVRQIIPEAHNQTPIIIKESYPPRKATCNINQLDGWDSTAEPVYGGYYIYNSELDGTGTYATTVFDSSFNAYGLSNYHVLKYENADILDPHGNHIGNTTAELNCEEDWALFQFDSDVNFRYEVKYSGYNGVSGYYTQDGLADLVANSATCRKVGQTTCETYFTINDYNATTYDYESECLRNTWQVGFEAVDSDFDPGDSGSLAIHESPTDNDWCWAVSVLAYFYPTDDHDISGVGAFRIADAGYSF